MAIPIKTLSALAFSAVCSALALTVAPQQVNALTLTDEAPVINTSIDLLQNQSGVFTQNFFNFNSQSASVGALTSINSISILLTLNDGDTATVRLIDSLLQAFQAMSQPFLQHFSQIISWLAVFSGALRQLVKIT